MRIIIPITKEEAVFLRTHLDRVFITKPSHHGKRYLEETVRAVKLLSEYRDGKYGFGGNN